MPVKRVMNLFRAVTRSNEFSERALFLTAHAIRLNPGNYTAWFETQPTTTGRRLDEDLMKMKT